MTLENQTMPYRLTVPCGKTLSFPFWVYEDDAVTPEDLSGWTGRCQVRDAPGGALQATVSVNIGPENKVTLVAAPDQTRGVTQNAAYDVELVRGTEVIGVLHGPVTAIEEVTLP